MTKTIGDTKVKHISLLILKISFLTLFGCGVKIHKINPIFGYRVKKTFDTHPTGIGLNRCCTVVTQHPNRVKKLIFSIKRLIY